MQTTPKANNILGHFFALLGAVVMLAIATWVTASTSEQVQPLDNLAVPRTGHTATALSDGRILITGGRDTDGNLVAASEIFDPETQTSSASAMLHTARVDHSATVLVDGRVLLTGGSDGSGPLSSAEIFDPANPGAGFQVVASPMTAARTRHTATLLNNGSVLIAGGETGGTAEIFDPATQSFTPTLWNLQVARNGHTATLFTDDSVLLAGGNTASMEMFTPLDQKFTLDAATLSVIRTGHWAFELSDTRLLLFQGDTGNSIDEFNPVTDTITPKGSLDFHASSSSLLANGRVLVLGTGVSGLYDPNAVPPAPDFTQFDEVSIPNSGTLPRSGQATVTLPGDKKILITGGVDGNNQLLGQALYNPAKIWTDKDDYLPDEPVILSGSGWQANEPVYLFAVDNETEQWTYEMTVNADPNGEFILSPYFIVELRHLGVQFHVTAVGQSTMQADVYFTDSQPGSVSLTPSSVTVSPGTSAIYGVAATQSGNTNPCTITFSLTYTGTAPVGTSPSFAPNPVTMTNGNVSSTLTITTTSGGPPAGRTQPGTYPFTVTAGRGGNCQGGGQDPVATGTLVVAATTTTTVSSTPNPSTYGQSVSFTATVTSGSGTPTGSVTFYDGACGGTSLGSSPVDGTGHASVSTASLNVGSHTITACYSPTGGFQASSGSGGQTVNRKNLTISGAVAQNKVYDGTVSATVNFGGATLNGVVSGDTVTINSSGSTASFNNKNVGTGKPVTVTGVTLSGASAGNYTVSQPTGLTANITARNLTVTATGVDKVYDGTTIATATLSDNRISGDVFTDTYTSASFATKNVGTGKTVNVSGISISGTDAGNYTLSNTTATATANITAKHVIGMFTAGNKPYDGNTTATVGLRIVNGPISGDAVSLTGGTATFDNKNVGTGKTVTLIGATLTGTDAGNYVLDSVNTTTADITALHITGNFTANNKVYDGTTGATVSSRSLNGVIGGDAVSLTGGTATFSDKNVGNGKTLTLTGASLTGTGAGNYVLDSVSTTTADITAHALTVTATGIDKEYDGNTTASVTLTTDKISGDVVTANYTAASFADKNVGANKSVSVSGISISGTDAGNYNLTNTTASTTANITARALTVTAHGVDREYDGTTIASVTLTTDKITGDVVTAAYTAASFADKNVGTNKSVSVTGIWISGTDAGNYNLTNTTASTTANITVRALTVTAHGVDREYDGTTIASVTLTTDKISGDVVTANYTAASFADKNVGTNKSVSVTGISISGADAGNYNLTNTTASTTANITARALTVTAHGVDKEYDSTTTASVTLTTDKITGDVVTTAYTAASFADKNVGNGKTVSVIGISIGGTDAGNYNLLNTTATTTANITARGLTVTAHGVNKVYDGTTTAAVTLTTDELTGDVITASYASASFPDKNVGNGKTVSVIGISIGGTDVGNYNLLNTTASTTANITGRDLTVTAHGVNKVYDGTTTATVTLSDDRVSGDVFTDSYTSASFANKNVGTGIAVSVSGISISGGDSGNYILGNTTASTTADITGRALTVSATGINKIYDGTTTATVTLSDDRVSGDVFTDSYTSASFASKNVGTGIAVSVSGISISGGDSGNYILGTTTASTTADITGRDLTVTAHGVNKVYDGTMTATVTLSDDRVSGDVFTDSYTSASFANKNVGTGIAVSVSGISISGGDSGNYILGNTTASTTADITGRALTVSATGINKIYDGTTTATVTLSDDRVSGDVFTDSYTSASFADKNVGTNKSVSVTGISISGTDAVNYSLVNTTASTTADITVRALTVTAHGVDRAYDGTATALVTLSTDKISGDVVTASYTAASFADKNVGTNKSVSVIGIAIGGSDAGNYNLVNTTASTTANITVLHITGTFTAANKVYDGNNSSMVLTRSLVGAISGDAVSLTGGTATFNDKNVGMGKTVTLAGATLSGADSVNYILDSVATTTADITARNLTITAATNTKPYDTNTSAAATPTVSGLQGSDTVTGLSETYDNKNVGTGKTLSVATYMVNDGNSGNNYVVSTVTNNTGVVTAVTLTITAVTNTKPYDANTSAAAVPTVSGLQGSDTVTGLSEAYANKNVGTGKTLSVATYMVNDGNSGNNYVVSTVTNNTGVVTAVTLTITAVTNTKTYDCNTTAAAMPTVSGLQPGDTVTGKVEVYATANAGTGKTLNVTAYTVNDGNGGTNYIVTTVPNNTGVVNKANTTTSVTSSPNPSVIGQIVTFTATVTPPTPCTPGGSVQFYDGAALLGTGTLNGLNPNSATFSTSSLTAGSHSITATYVGDSNFNPSTSSASTQNVNYTFIGFLPPIDNPPVLNQVKAGQVIPVKWQLKNSSGAIICDLSTLVVMQSISIGCDSHDPIDDIEEVVPPGGTVFRCDGTQFIFNWQTPKSWAGTCRQLQVTLSDGHTYIANFKFK